MPALKIEIVEGAHKAPDYNKGHRIEGHPVQNAELVTAIIVPKGMAEGRPSVDLQFLIKDAQGNTVGAAVALISGTLLQQLAGAIRGVESRG